MNNLSNPYSYQLQEKPRIKALGSQFVFGQNSIV